MEDTSSFSGNVYSYYNQRLLESAERNLVLWGLGMSQTQPKGRGVDHFMLRYGNVSASTSTITEGVTPAEADIATNKYTITASQYGQWISYTDWLAMTAIDDVSENIADRLGYAAALSTDTLIRDHLIANATTSLQYVGAGNTVDNDISAGEVFTATDVLKATRVLRAADAPDFDGLYTWVVHEYQAHDLMSDTSAGGFIELNKYVQGLADKPLKGEVGKVYGARVVRSNNVASVANSGPVNVYRTFVMAKDSFVVTKFDKNHIKLIKKDPKEGGIANPLELKGSCGYKLQFGVKYIGGSFTNHNGASPDLVIQLRGASSGG
jgi:N4-gp56 family major capsid protein